MHLITRESLPSIHEVEIDGTRHGLGILKDLRQNPDFARLVPDQARLSVSWVHLKDGERLDEHRHPTTSAIIVTEGSGMVTGDLRGTLKPGDMILVAPGALHGFVGKGPDGFWGLSLQFEGRALYEDLSRPRVVFREDANGATEAKLALLTEENERYLEAYRSNPLVRLVESGAVEKNERVRARLLDGLHYWSNVFQRVLFMRAALESPAAFQRLAERHIKEEVGHNDVLGAMREEGATAAWDPILAATTNWFVERMASLSPAEQTIVVHFVLEGSGDVFHKAASPVFPDTPHFKTHAGADEDHLRLGIEALKLRPDLDLPACREALRQGWAMMNALSARIAELASAEASS